MAMCYAVRGARERNVFFVSELCHPQTIDVVRTRAAARGWRSSSATTASFEFGRLVFGVLLQYPATDGAVDDYRASRARARERARWSPSRPTCSR
jgi:glycine dehydrogenase